MNDDSHMLMALLFVVALIGVGVLGYYLIRLESRVSLVEHEQDRLKKDLREQEEFKENLAMYLERVTLERRATNSRVEELEKDMAYMRNMSLWRGFQTLKPGTGDK